MYPLREHVNAHVEFWKIHNQAERSLRTWHAAVSKAEWKGPDRHQEDVRSHVDFVADNRVIFDIAGNKYRLVVHVSYTYKSVLIKFVGTHAEYDAIHAETVKNA